MKPWRLALLLLALGGLSGWADEPKPSPADEPKPSPVDTKRDEAAAAKRVEAFLGEWAEAMRDVRTLRVAFKQKKKLRILKRPLVREGETLLVGRTVLMVTKGKDGEPETELLVTPTEAKLYHPRLKRLEVFPIEEGATPPTPFPLFGSDLKTLPERYGLALEEHEGGERTLVLVPRDPKAPLAETRMRFKGTTISSVTQRSKRGDQVEIEVTRFERNVKIERELKLDIAPGTKVSRVG